MNLLLLVCIVSQIIGNFRRLQFCNLCKYVLESPWKLPLSQTKFFSRRSQEQKFLSNHFFFREKVPCSHLACKIFLHQGSFKRRGWLLCPSKRANKFVKERCTSCRLRQCQETCSSVVFMVCSPVLSVKVSLCFLLQTSIHIPQTQHLQLFEGKLRIEGNKQLVIYQ